MSDIEDLIKTASDAKNKAADFAKDGLTGEEVSDLVGTVTSKKTLLLKIAAAAGIILALAGGYFVTKGDADEPVAAPTTEVAPVTTDGVQK